MVVQNGRADIYFKDADGNDILYSRDRDDFFQSSVQLRVTVWGNDITFVKTRKGSLVRFFDDLFTSNLNTQQQDALAGAIEAALVGDADLMQLYLDVVLEGQTGDEISIDATVLDTPLLAGYAYNK